MNKKVIKANTSYLKRILRFLAYSERPFRIIDITREIKTNNNSIARDGVKFLKSLNLIKQIKGTNSADKRFYCSSEQCRRVLMMDRIEGRQDV